MSMKLTWGTTPEERAMPFPCDRLMERFDAAYYRGISVDAAPEIVYRWLCQMRVAPYSYDLIDNGGKPSPRRLIEGMDHLELGQQILIGFEVVEFEPGRHITFKGGPRHVRVFGEMVATYMAVPREPSGSRLLVKVLAQYPKGLQGKLMKLLLPWGDFLMMRKQLLTFKELAESTDPKLLKA
jgi:hypothetical protein